MHLTAHPVANLVKPPFACVVMVFYGCIQGACVVTGFAPPKPSKARQQPQQLWDSRLSLRCRFHDDGRAIRQNFRDPLHHFRGVVAGADDGVASHIRRVLQHQVERFRARPLA